MESLDGDRPSPNNWIQSKFPALVSSVSGLGPDFLALYRSRTRSDVSLIVQSREFKVHRLILSTRSRYFAELFEANPSQSQFLLAENFNSDAFDSILEYLYGGQIIINTNRIDILEPIARKLRLDKLQETLSTFNVTELTELNVLPKLISYHEEGNQAAVKQCLLFLDHVITKIRGVAELKFLGLPFELMHQIVQRQTLGVNELQLYSLLLEWYKYQANKSTDIDEKSTNTDELKRQMKQLTKHLNFYLIAAEGPEVLFDQVKPNGWADVELLWDAVAVRFQRESERPDLVSLYKRRIPGPKGKKRVLNVAILGRQGAGKTSICDIFTKQKNASKAPELMRVVEMEHEAYTIKFRDYAGSKEGQKLWFSAANKNIDGLIWVIDSTDLHEENIDLINDFMDFVGNPALPVLIFAHKQDRGKDAALLQEVVSYLRIANRVYFSRTKRTFLEKWHIETTSIGTAPILIVALKWLVDEMVAFGIEKKKKEAKRRLNPEPLLPPPPINKTI